jgi:molecular chaperone DnaK
MGNFVGIDLGTTFSAVGQIDDTGRPVIVRNKDGKNITPSVVSFSGSDSVLVGEEARKTLGLRHTNTFGRFKREMGTSTTYEALGETYTPTALSSFVLKKLKEETEAAIGPIDGAIVTIPANFANEAREATMEAAKIAGLDIKHIINEPTAAALFYAYESEKQLGGVYAVYDLGGGTFDVSIVRLSGQDVDLMATEGLQKLGGDDFDETLRKIAKAKYAEATGGELDDESFAKNDAEELKISLSSRDKVEVRLRADAGKAMITITREEFEEAISSLITSTVMLCETAMSDAGVTPSEVQGVFLAGGSTRLPAVLESVRRVFEQEPQKSGNVDEVVALGAALYAAHKADDSKLNSMQRQSVAQISLAEITSNFFGTIHIGHNQARGENALQNSVLIKKGDKIPCSVTETFYTMHEGQEAVNCRVTQSKSPERDPKFVREVWAGELRLPPGRPENQEIEVTFSYDENGIMRCAFVDKASGQEKTVDLNVTEASESGDQGVERFRVE